jgi:hypothetical protein
MGDSECSADVTRICGECAGTGEVCERCKSEKRLTQIREVLREGFGPRWAQGATKPVLYDAAADLLRMVDAERTRNTLLRGIVEGHERKVRDVGAGWRVVADLDAKLDAARRDLAERTRQRDEAEVIAHRYMDQTTALKAAHADAERDLAEAHARAEEQRKKIAELRERSDKWQRECEFSRRAYDRIATERDVERDRARHMCKRLAAYIRKWGEDFPGDFSAEDEAMLREAEAIGDLALG